MSERSELMRDTESVAARDASERGPAYEKRSEERERAMSTARTLCHIGAAVAVGHIGAAVAVGHIGAAVAVTR